MGETIAETRVEIAAARVEMERTAERLREALDIRARIAERPAVVIGVGAAALFLLAGGPRRVARRIRRSLRPGEAAQHYDALPHALQAWVDTMAGGRGSAREALVEELRAWQQAPTRSGKVRKELTRRMVEGPPGPWRTAWVAAEAGLTILSAALARRAIARFLTDEGPNPDSRPAAASNGTAPDQVPPDASAPSHAGAAPSPRQTRSRR